MEFASRLLSEDFEYDPADHSRQDLIVAEREPIDETSIWGSPDPRLMAAWREILSQDDSADAVSKLAEAAIEHRVAQGNSKQSLREVQFISGRFSLWR